MLKDEILRLLEENKGAPVSGLLIGRTLGVSRSAVWKEIRRLQGEGFPISAVPNKGYVLDRAGGVILAEAVSASLRTRRLGRALEILPSVDSTNTFLKSRAESLCGCHGYTVIALEQTAGRGRMSRSFHSPKQCGIYMSVYLEPEIPFSDLSLITVAAVVAVCRAIRETAGFSPSVKWVNDVLYDGKKLCGILTEASLEAESGRVRYVIPGIGINLSSDPLLPDELVPIAGAVNDYAEEPCDRNRLIASVLNHFEDLLELLTSGRKEKIVSEYRSLLCVFGQTYRILSGAEPYEAVPVDLDEDAHLIVRDGAGALHTLRSGEISIRKAEN